MPTNRVTYRSMSFQALRGIQGSMERVQDLQGQLATTRRVTKAGDDPGAAGASLLLRTQQRANAQYLRNIDDATGRLNTTDGALQAISERLRSARELVLSAANAATNSAARSAISAELRGIASEVTDLYNTQWLGRPVFGGTVSGNQAVDPATGNYLGDDQEVTARISREATMRVDTSGTSAGANTIPAALAQAISDVSTNAPSMATSLNSLQAALDTVLTSIGDVGARAARLETTRQHVEYEIQDFTGRISEFEDADIAETMMKLQSQQVAYQAALGAASKVLQTSLLDFLR